MSKPRKFSSNRRNFLKGAAVAGAASMAAATPAAAGALYEKPEPGKPPLQDPRAETATPAEVDVMTTDHCGSDFMVDVLRSLDIE
jgi:acetolactate synthase-1/2/3 large subunit